MTKARDLANLGAYDTIEPTASGLVVTGEATVTGTVSVGSNFTQNSQQSASGGGNISPQPLGYQWLVGSHFGTYCPLVLATVQ